MIELNQEALKAAEQMRYQGPSLTGDIVRAYLEALPKPAPKTRSVPFDKDKVKPGDEVVCIGNACKFHGLNALGQAIIEWINGGVSLHDIAKVMIPVPVETVKVALLRCVETNEIWSCTEVSALAMSDGFEQVSEWTEIEVTK